MKNKHLFITLLCVTLTMTACRSSYKISGIERTRILIDSRYDKPLSKELDEYMEPFTHAVDSIKSPVVGKAAQYMSAKRPEGLLSNLLPDILMWAAKDYNEKPDFAVYNIGGIRAAVAEGTVTYGDIMEVAPFENKICFVTLSSEKTLELLQQIAKRGGEGLSHGVQLRLSEDGKLLQAHINGEDVKAKNSYRVATIDFVAQGNDDMTAFKASTDVVMPKEEKNNVRNVIAEYFKEKMKNGETVDAKVEGRIVIEK